MTRARAVAQEFERALRATDPAEADRLCALAAAVGEAWVAGCPIVEDTGGLVSEQELAERIGRTPSAVRNLVHRGVGPGASRGEGRKLTRYPGGFDPREAEELIAWASRQKSGVVPC